MDDTEETRVIVREERIDVQRYIYVYGPTENVKDFTRAPDSIRSIDSRNFNIRPEYQNLLNTKLLLNNVMSDFGPFKYLIVNDARLLSVPYLDLLADQSLEENSSSFE